MKVLSLLLLLCCSFAQILYQFDCNVESAMLTINQPMTPITCTTSMPQLPRITPDLPAGLTYTIESIGSQRTVTISGTPKEGYNPRLFYIGYNAYIATVIIAVYAQPTFCSYGFDSMTLYTDIDMEPIPIHCDAAVHSFTIQPALPEGMVINEQTGMISGRLAVSDKENKVYTVTATTNGFGSTTTTFTFRARDQIEMNARGAIGCYWKTITECKVPDFDFFYKNPAQLCQTVNELHFTDNNVDNTWPGLDRRFVDFYSAYFYTYILILHEATYEFSLSSDDGAILYLDDLTTPFISREACRALSEDSKSKILTQGRHLIVIRFFEYNQWSSMYLKYGSAELGLDRVYLNGEYMRVGGRGPTFISYDTITGYVNTDLPYYMPQLSSGAPVSWAIEPALPQGMNIDANGYISGRPGTPSSAKYTVTATGVNGVATTEVDIVITETMVPGFRSKFYTVTDSEMCSYNMLTGNTIRLSQISVMDNVDYALSAQAAIWTGFPQDFTKMFYVEWEGYLHMQTIGKWRLRLTCTGGCKLIGADEQQIINFWGCHNFQSKETLFAVSRVGYYYFRVEYQQKDGEKGIKFEWLAPGTAWEAVPANKIFYLPTGVLSYKHEQAHYYVNAPIQNNVPMFFSVPNLNNFRIFPTLPTGLNMNPSTGLISGTPSAQQIMTRYTVTARSGANDVDAVIAFDAQQLPAPADLSYVQGSTAITVSNPLVLVPLVSMTPLTIVNPQGVTVTTYSITPALPQGLTLDEGTGAISGKPTKPSANQVYTIMATNPAGSMPLMVALSVTGCKGASWSGEFLSITFHSGYGSVSVVQTSNVNTVQKCSVDTMQSDGNAYENMDCTANVQAGSSAYSTAIICINPALISASSVRVTCTDNSGCRWQIRRQDGSYFPYRYAYTDIGYQPYYDSVPYPSAATPLSQITLSKNTLNAFSGFIVEAVGVTLNGCYNSITINPPMGSVTIDPGYPMLSGIAAGTGTVTYTVTASGPAGSANAQLIVTYQECSAANGHRLVNFIKKTTMYGTEESWELRKESQVIYSSGLLAADMTYSNTFCLETGDYNVVLKDSYGDGWSNGATLTVESEDGAQLGHWSWSHSGSQNYKESVEVWTLEGTAVETTWRYLINGNPGRNWNAIDFDRSGWSTIVNGNVGTWSQNGVYFVYEFELEDGDIYPVVEFGVYYRDGLIVYLNGEEVYRRNMGSGRPSQTTAASGSFDGYLVRLGTAPGYLLKTGKNVLAVEMHRVSSVSGPIMWNGHVSYNSGDCVTRSVGGTIRESLFYDKEGSTAQEAWNNDYTQWTENGLPAWTVYSYDFDHVEWINRVTVGSSLDDESRDPAKFTIYGSNDGVSWEKLYGYEKTEMFESRNQPKSFMMMDHMSSYGQYKFEVTRTRSGVAQVSVSQLALEACRLSYCPKDGDYPGTPAGTSVSIDCPEGFVGERYRSCSNDMLKPTWSEPDETECRSKIPAKGTSYLDLVLVISPTDMITMTTEGAGALAAVMSSNLDVPSKSIEIWKAKDVTDLFTDASMGTKTKIAVWIRISMDDAKASSVLSKLGGAIYQIQSDLNSYYSTVFPETLIIAFYKDPELNQYKGYSKVSGWLVFLVVVLILIVVGIFGFLAWTRIKNKGKKNGSKRLKNGTTKSAMKAKTKGKQARV